jgi:hypothetical protein
MKPLRAREEVVVSIARAAVHQDRLPARESNSRVARPYAFFRKKIIDFFHRPHYWGIMSKKNIVYADPTKKKFVVTLQDDGTHCVLVHNRDWGIELRGRKNPPGADLRIKKGVEVRINRNK